MESVLSILLVCALLGGIAASVVTFYGKTYVRAADTAFTVLQITDVHILNNEKKDAKAFKTITAMVKATAPDMIVVTGDITSEKENFTAFKTFGSFMESLQIPWAFVYGNHEGLDIAYEPPMTRQRVRTNCLRAGALRARAVQMWMTKCSRPWWSSAAPGAYLSDTTT